MFDSRLVFLQPGLEKMTSLSYVYVDLRTIIIIILYTTPDVIPGGLVSLTCLSCV